MIITKTCLITGANSGIGKQAAIQLKEGHQVSITADNCGFNSVTYFSKCFKQHYGVSPKIYQQTCNNSNE